MATEIVQVEGPDGMIYDVEVVDGNTTGIKEAIRADISKQAQEELALMPWYSRMGQATLDDIRVFGDTFSMGLTDRLSALASGVPHERTKLATELARERLGFVPELMADTAAIIPQALSLPTAVTSVVKRVGGGPIVRGIVGGTTAASETAALGATEAAIRGNDIGKGAAEGALWGLGGYGITKGIQGAANKGKKALQDLGVLAKPPAPVKAPVVKKVGRPSKATLAAKALAEKQADQGQRLYRVVTNARRKAGGPNSAGYDKAIGSKLQAILDDPKKSAMYTPETLAAMERVVAGDPIMKVGRGLGHIPMISGGAAGAGLGAGVGFMFGGPPLATIGSATGAGLGPALGVVGRRTADKGAERLTGEMMRIASKNPKPQPVIPEEAGSSIYNLIRLLGIQN